MDKIKEMKAEIFDILVMIDAHKMEIQKLDQIKNKKVEELNNELTKPVPEVKEDKQE